ncbi:hypothetical protein L1987_32773 [Smallanthus sonchifolius]|uniref:Uncharacterized protein n=1 Tax=Smallanthus sonchifolius TaxID=185202 RepID=A0ACB9HQH3_9ASTR|nr:hypothetical protein L1987_32773 [Smallanthus sonchifolius]
MGQKLLVKKLEQLNANETKDRIDQVMRDSEAALNWGVVNGGTDSTDKYGQGVATLDGSLSLDAFSGAVCVYENFFLHYYAIS